MAARPAVVSSLYIHLSAQPQAPQRPGNVEDPCLSTRTKPPKALLLYVPCPATGPALHSYRPPLDTMRTRYFTNFSACHARRGRLRGRPLPLAITLLYSGH